MAVIGEATLLMDQLSGISRAKAMYNDIKASMAATQAALCKGSMDGVNLAMANLRNEININQALLHTLRTIKADN